jgi:hypothetical protein
MPRTIQSFYDLSHIVAIKFFNDFNGYVGVPEHGEKNMLSNDVLDWFWNFFVFDELLPFSTVSR